MIGPNPALQDVLDQFAMMRARSVARRMRPSPPDYGPYACIYADPPWRFANWSNGEMAKRGEKWARRNGRSPYDVMATAEIAAVPVADLAARDCVLFLWATYPKLEDALKVMHAWGFQFKTVAFTWAKTNPSGNGWHCGLGYWTGGNAEICLLGTRGHPKRVSKLVRNLVVAPRGAHSAKPPEVRDHIIRLLGPIRRIELFARERAPGWDACGLEIDGHDINESIRRVLCLRANLADHAP